MPDLVDRMCVHQRVWCPLGCHDQTPYVASNAGMELLLGLAEDWANDGELDSFHTFPDPRSGLDGLDELVESNLIMFDWREGADHDYDSGPDERV